MQAFGKFSPIQQALQQVDFKSSRPFSFEAVLTIIIVTIREQEI